MGQDLDINHGLDYPNVTSRMCSSSQLIADAGLSPFKVNDIYMIIRPYPIRISNKTNIGRDIYSGNYAGSTEITWNEVKHRCGCNIDLEEYTTVTKKIEKTTNTPVTMIGTGERICDIIDLRQYFSR